MCGRRHGDCYITAIHLSKLASNEYKVLDEYNEYYNTVEEGFLTNLNRFVDRYEAWELEKEITLFTEISELQKGLEMAKAILIERFD